MVVHPVHCNDTLYNIHIFAFIVYIYNSGNSFEKNYRSNKNTFTSYFGLEKMEGDLWDME